MLVLGLEVRIMPAGYEKPYVKRNKNGAADAEAIREAGTRPTMRFVAVKTAARQSLMMLHRTRSLLVRQRTMLVNAMRAHLAESNWPPGSVCAPNRTRPAARNAWEGSPSREINISDGCSSPAPCR